MVMFLKMQGAHGVRHIGDIKFCISKKRIVSKNN